MCVWPPAPLCWGESVPSHPPLPPPPLSPQQSLAGGSVSEALVDLTGGVGQKITLTDAPVKEMAISGKLWSELKKCVLPCCSCSYAQQQPLQCWPFPLVQARAGGLPGWLLHECARRRVRGGRGHGHPGQPRLLCAVPQGSRPLTQVPQGAQSVGPRRVARGLVRRLEWVERAPGCGGGAG